MDLKEIRRHQVNLIHDPNCLVYATADHGRWRAAELRECFRYVLWCTEVLEVKIFCYFQVNYSGSLT